MGSSTDLLRMLEPAVRPDGVNGPSRPSKRPFAQPIESQSFDQLLQQAEAAQLSSGALESKPTTDVTDAGGKVESPLSALAGLNRIENASLRQLFEATQTND